MPVRKAKPEDTVESRVIKLLKHRDAVGKIFGETETQYSAGYMDGVTAAIKIVCNISEIERAILSSRVETREQ
jgi:hypothetical protein